MNRLFVNKGEKVIYKEKICVIVRVLSIDEVSIEESTSGIIHSVHVRELQTGDNEKKNINDLHGLSDKEWQKAQNRYKIIQPILSKRGDLQIIQDIAQSEKISVPTLYRWLKMFDDSGLVSALVGKKRMGGKGVSRLSEEKEDIINNIINRVYLNNSRKSIIKTIREIKIACKKQNIDPPHANTVRNRIKNISEETKIRKRLGIQEARYRFEPLKGSFPNADYPLAVIQIDHTLVDIILVDEQSRKPLRRPWITLAMDVYSRMVVGFYLSYDSPGALGTGMCISNAILPKEIWMAEIGVDAEWPCWGVMDVIHTDNAKEFRGNMLKRACINYGIDLQFRPVGSPHFGGHIERILGTFSTEIHDLPGTTFSNVADRKNYQSKDKASFTLPEFEKWLTIYITKIYHERIHSEINTTPIKMYNDGILGTKTVIGRGIPPRINNERKVRLDFMPYVERSIQEYGVVIDHIYYYSDVLRSYIHDEEKGIAKKHIFKRDPRDISVIYFYEPSIQEYYDIPYRDASLSPMSVWEYRDIVRKLKDNRIEVNETSIFNAYRQLDEIEKRAIRQTKIQKNNIKSLRNTLSEEDIENLNIEKQAEKTIVNTVEILPFEDLEDEAFN